MKRVLAVVGFLTAATCGIGVVPANAASDVLGAFAWGSNDYGPTNGPIGSGTTTNSDIPVAVDTTGALNGLTLTQISAGTEFTVALSAVELPPAGANTNGFVAVAGVFLAAGGVLVAFRRGRSFTG